MGVMFPVIFLLVLLFPAILARDGFGPTDQEWGYVSVRPDNVSQMFYWLHYTTAADDPLTRPLVIWLQGGPGDSSTGFGYFQLIGPLDVDLNPRNTSWVNYVNVLFVDSPVGAGFSYAEDAFYDYDNFAANNTQIATDFLAFMQGFLEQLPQFQHVPIYIFSEEYGGKMCVEIALVLYENIQSGNLNCNLVGIGLGDPWISPVHSIGTWADYLFKLGFLDTFGYTSVTAMASTTAAYIKSGQYTNATYYYQQTVQLIRDLTNQVDTKNVLTPVFTPDFMKTHNKKFVKPFSSLRESDENKIFELMETAVKNSLQLTCDFGTQTSLVSNALQDYLVDATDVVEKILNTTSLKVVVYNGQLDLSIDTPGTVKWLDELHWSGADFWKTATRTGLVVDSVYEGFVKTFGNLTFYLVSRSGEMVAADNPSAMEYILRNITNNFQV